MSGCCAEGCHYEKDRVAERIQCIDCGALPQPPMFVRDDLLAYEIERQRAIYRLGMDEAVLRRAALNALMDKGDWR